MPLVTSIRTRRGRLSCSVASHRPFSGPVVPARRLRTQNSPTCPMARLGVWDIAIARPPSLRESRQSRSRRRSTTSRMRTSARKTSGSSTTRGVRPRSWTRISRTRRQSSSMAPSSRSVRPTAPLPSSRPSRTTLSRSHGTVPSERRAGARRTPRS